MQYLCIVCKGAAFKFKSNDNNNNRKMGFFGGAKTPLSFSKSLLFGLDGRYGRNLQF